MSLAATANTARVDSLSHWTTIFHPNTGSFRLPSTSGELIEHLDIDLRFIDHEAGSDTPAQAIYLPRVWKLTLRGAEHVQDSEEQMACLSEVLLAIRPVEVHWWVPHAEYTTDRRLNASNDPDEQLTFSTHLVHPAIIAAGEFWSHSDVLRRLVIQGMSNYFVAAYKSGGFPCPNLSAPTPFFLTPVSTPCHSPGPVNGALSNIPFLSMTKPKPIDPIKLDERAERKRLAEYCLKPRFEYAFGSWAPEELRWRLDGKFT